MDSPQHCAGCAADFGDSPHDLRALRRITYPLRRVFVEDERSADLCPGCASRLMVLRETDQPIDLIEPD